MKCPYCRSNELKVIDSRDVPDSNTIRRRRECLSCQKRFTTFETVELTIQIHKKDGRYEDFQQQKLLNGLLAACSHTKVNRDQAITLSAKITDEIIEMHQQTINSDTIGKIVMKHLQALDSIAYIRFACVYRRFKDIDELVEAIQTMHTESD